MLRRAACSLRLRGCRALGTWTAEFESARGGTLTARRELSARLVGDETAFKVERDEAEAEAMEREAGQAAGSQLTYVLSVQGTAVAILRAALMPSGSGFSGLLIGAQADPALALADIGPPLIRAARAELTTRGAERVVAVAPLPGLCRWVVDNSAWTAAEAEDAKPADILEIAAAVEAVAKGVPRPGHSVLGVGTFKAARPAFERLAFGYAQRTLALDPDSEVAMFTGEGAELVQINWMHDASEEALRDCAGCTATLRF